RAGAINLSDADLETLLRRRLRLITLLLLLGGAAGHLVKYGTDYLTIAGGTLPAMEWYRWTILGSEVGVVTTSAVLLGLLTVRRGLPLRMLRWVELVVCAVLAADSLIDEIMLLTCFAPSWTARWGDTEPVRLLWVFAPPSIALNWFALLVGYGALIPNTWRRCAAVVGSMAGGVVVVSVALFLNADPVQRAYQVNFFALV